MKHVLRRKVFGMSLLAFSLPIAALADLNQTITLQANTTLNLETGVTGNSGGDILWSGSTITPQGNATALSIGEIPFNLATEATLRFLPGYSQDPIDAADLKVNDVLAVHTNAGRYARVLVQAKAGGSITLRFTTFGAPAGTGGEPSITAIENNSSRIPVGFPNYGIAPSSLFVVVGSALSDAGDPVLQSSLAPGIPLTLKGASITVVVNGVTTHPGLWYASPGQLAAVLPAATPVGNGTLTVTHNGVTSAPAAIRVVPSALGINVYNGNIGVATEAVTGALLTVTSSGLPGQDITLWTTGLGADPDDSDTIFSTSPHSVATPLQIYIGGVLATILYQGSAGYPGVNQINVTIPASVPTGCFVPVIAVTGNVVSNAVTLPIRARGGACVDAVTGYSGDQLSRVDLKAGLVSVVKTVSPGNGGAPEETNSANGGFGQYTGLAEAATLPSASPGGCVVFPLILGGAIPNFKGLDAGMITMTGPGGLNVTLETPLGIKGAYNALLASGAIPQSGGSYTFHGAGGVDVGSFTSTVELANPLLTWTNSGAAASIDKSQGLLVTWSGGNPGTYVAISGTAGMGAANPPVVGGFSCLAPVEAGQFTVPSYILLGLPPGNGATEIQNNVYVPFSATGLDQGLALGNVSISVDSQYH